MAVHVEVAVPALVLPLLFLVSGDVHSNPGLVRFPVRSNQDGIECSTCSSWCHHISDGMSTWEYAALLTSDDNWFCYCCVSSLVPSPTSLDNSKPSFVELSPDIRLSNQCSRHTVLSPSSATTNFVRPISCFYFNSRSVVNNLMDLSSLISVCVPDVLSISKTYLDSSVLDAEIVPCTYVCSVLN